MKTERKDSPEITVCWRAIADALEAFQTADEEASDSELVAVLGQVAGDIAGTHAACCPTQFFIETLLANFIDGFNQRVAADEKEPLH